MFCLLFYRSSRSSLYHYDGDLCPYLSHLHWHHVLWLVQASATKVTTQTWKGNASISRLLICLGLNLIAVNSCVIAVAMAYLGYGVCRV